MSEQERMDPFSGEPVEVDGIYEDEWGREIHLNRGELFPTDSQLGNTTWKLVGLAHETRTGLKPDPRLDEAIHYTDKHKDRVKTDHGD